MDRIDEPAIENASPPGAFPQPDEDFQTPREHPATEIGFGPSTRASSPSMSVPSQVVLARGGAAGTPPEERELSKVVAEQRYVDALVKATAELRKMSRRRPFTDNESVSSTRSSTPSHSESEDSFGEDDFPPTDSSPIHHEEEVKYIIKKWDSKQNVYVTTEGTTSATPLAKTLLDENHAFTWKSLEDRHGGQRQEAIIHCPKLRKLLATTLKDYPFRHWDVPRLRFESPFYSLVHNWKRLSDIADCPPDLGSCGTHLRRLLDVVRQTKRLKSYLDHRERGMNTIHFWHLGYLFAPGQIVYASVSNQPQAFRVYYHRYIERWMELYCWSYAFDGKAFDREPYRFVFERYEGGKQIQMLRCYPLEYHEDKATMRDALIERGLKFRNISIREKDRKMCSYMGNIIYCSDRPEDLFGTEDANIIMQVATIGLLADRGSRRERGVPDDDLDRTKELHSRARIIPYSGQVIVDPEAYKLYGPQWTRRHSPLHRPEPWKECDCSKCQANPELRELLKTKYDNVRKSPSGFWPTFEDDQLLICPPHMTGYALAKKLWVAMDVRKLDLIEEASLSMPAISNALGSSNWAFDSVILPDNAKWRQTKELIRMLIQNHTNRSNALSEKESGVPAPLQDLVEGKGEGLVILFYGQSGVGKTLLAETVARYTGKPLLKVSVADIGLTVVTVERKLEELFDIATRWNAVLLFDEADILLEQRTDQANLTRNSIVSVFLKVLEYFEGILLLTTNRLLTFDIAIQSRIHLAVKFPKMDEECQKRVMNVFLRTIDKEDMDYEDIHRWLETYLNAEFNGRQIRNVFSAAITRARSRKTNRRLLLEDIQVFWMHANEFRKDLGPHTDEVQERQLTPHQVH